MMMPFMTVPSVYCDGCRGRRAQQSSVTFADRNAAIVLDSLERWLRALPGFTETSKSRSWTLCLVQRPTGKDDRASVRILIAAAL